MTVPQYHFKYLCVCCKLFSNINSLYNNDIKMPFIASAAEEKKKQLPEVAEAIYNQ